MGVACLGQLLQHCSANWRSNGLSQPIILIAGQKGGSYSHTPMSIAGEKEKEGGRERRGEERRGEERRGEKRREEKRREEKKREEKE